MLHHVAIAVDDIDETAAWYAKHFQFSELHRYDTSGMTFCMLERDGFRLELIKHNEDHQSLPEYRRDLGEDLKVAGVKHFCLEVADIEAEFARLKAAGVELRGEPKAAGFGGRYFFVKDSNGILFEIWASS